MGWTARGLSLLLMGLSGFANTASAQDTSQTRVGGGCSYCASKAATGSASANTSTAQGPSFGFGARVGPTTGFGLDAGVGLGHYVGLRAGLNFGTLSFDQEEEGIDYRAKLSYSSGFGLIDVMPGGGSFRFTAGVHSKPLRARLKASGPDEYEIGDHNFRGDLDLDGRIKLGNAAPYLGFGFGGTPNDYGFGMTLDFGVLFASKPKARLETAGRVCDDTLTPGCDPNGPLGFDVNNLADPRAVAFQQEVDREIDDLEDDAKDFKTVPVATLGLQYRFGGASRRSASPEPASVAPALPPPPPVSQPLPPPPPPEPVSPITTTPMDEGAIPPPAPPVAPLAAPAAVAPATSTAPPPLLPPPSRPATAPAKRPPPPPKSAAGTAGMGAAAKSTLSPGRTVAPRPLILRERPTVSEGKGTKVPAGAPIELRMRQQTTTTAIWWLVAPIGGSGSAGWVTESELKP